MARARVIRPEFWSDEKLASVSRESRLTYVGMWGTSDDYGVTKGNPAWLRSQIFPYDDDVTVARMTEWLRELESIRRILPFIDCGEKYYYIPKFIEHQKVDKPSKTRNPAPPIDIASRDSRESLASLSRESSDETETETETETEKRELALSLVPAAIGGDPGSQVPTEVGTSKPDVADTQDDDNNVTVDVHGQGQAAPKPNRHPPCPHQDIIAAYHEAMPANPRIRHLDETSQRNLRARWREDPERQTVDWWRNFFAWCAQSRFLTGQKTDFIADLMWLVRPQNFAKALAGRYHHENPNGNLPLRTRQNMAAVEEVKRMIREGRL